MSSDPLGPFLRGLANRCARAFAEWFMHSLLLVGIFGVIQGLHWCLTNRLKVDPHKKFFGVFPLEWLFDGADLSLLIAVLVVGVNAAVRSYRGKD